MRIYIASPTLKIHETSLEKLIYDGIDLVVEFDDINENRVHMRFSPCQAIRVTTIDCFDVRSLFVDGRLTRQLLEIEESPWIAALKEELSHHDHSATFLRRAHHFVLPFQDNIVEVIAWQFAYTIT